MDRNLGSDQAGPPPSTPVIFVTDDDVSFRTAISRLLRASGYEVEAFDSAEAFLSRAVTAKFGCLVLDLHMPGQSGFQLQETLARGGHDLPIVFVTGQGDVPHDGLPSSLSADDNQAGWRSSLANLAALVEAG